MKNFPTVFIYMRKIAKLQRESPHLRDTGGSRRRQQWKENMCILYVVVVAVVVVAVVAVDIVEDVDDDVDVVD